MFEEFKSYLFQQRWCRRLLRGSYIRYPDGLWLRRQPNSERGIKLCVNRGLLEWENYN